MEEIKKESAGSCEHMCQTRWCKKWCCEGKGCPIFRWILGLIILIAVFSLGVKVGEFKGMIDGRDSGFGWNKHRGNQTMFYGYNYGGYGNNLGSGKMMRGWTQYPQQKSTSTQQ